MTNNTETRKYVQLKDLAADTGYAQAGMLRTVTRRGFQAFKLQTGPNKPYFLSVEDAAKFKERVASEKSNTLIENKNPSTADSGGVYVVEVPSYDGKLRYKIGWADNFQERFSSYRSIVPDLRVIAVWLTYDKWTERMAHKVAMTQGNKVFTELFEFPDSKLAVNQIRDVFDRLGIPCTKFSNEHKLEDPDGEPIEDTING
jgi:hypothetical protein